MPRKLKILLTGACGFMGSNFLRYLYTTYPDYVIYNLDMLTYAGNLDNLVDIEEAERALPQRQRRYHFLQRDVCDEVYLRDLLREQGFDIVVHFAAETHVDRAYFNISDFLRTNVEGTRHLLDASRMGLIKRLIHISTDEVYGTVTRGLADEEAPFRPSNPYATSKAAADLLVQSYVKTYGVPAVVIRSSNNYGPYQYPEKLIPLSVTNLAQGEKIPVHGRGTHVRSWLHVEDFIDAVDLIMHKAKTGSIYNLAGEEKTNLQIIDAIARHFGMKGSTCRVHVSDRPASDMRYAVSAEKLSREFGWKRKRTVKETLPQVIAWYLANEAWWKKIKAKKEYLDHYHKQAAGNWY